MIKWGHHPNPKSFQSNKTKLHIAEGVTYRYIYNNRNGEKNKYGHKNHIHFCKMLLNQ